MAGFHLAGVDAYSADNVEVAERLVEKWLNNGEAGLLAIDDGLLEKLDRSLVNRLDASEQLPYLAIPGGKPLGPEASERNRIAAMIRRAIGFHIVFKAKNAR